MDTYMRSKIPLKLILIIVVAAVINFCLVLGLQLLLNYRATGPISEETLAKLDSSYDGCTIWDRTENSAMPDNDLYVFLIAKPDGSEHLVTLRRHFLFDRYRIVKSGCKEIIPGTESIQVRAGTTMFSLDISLNQASGHSDIRWGSWSGQSPRTQFRNNMFLCISALCAVELAAWCLIFRKEEIA